MNGKEGLTVEEGFRLGSVIISMVAGIGLGALGGYVGMEELLDYREEELGLEVNNEAREFMERKTMAGK